MRQKYDLLSGAQGSRRHSARGEIANAYGGEILEQTRLEGTYNKVQMIQIAIRLGTSVIEVLEEIRSNECLEVIIMMRCLEDGENLSALV